MTAGQAGRLYWRGRARAVCAALLVGAIVGVCPGAGEGPYQRQTAEKVGLLSTGHSGAERAGAAEALGYLRNPAAADALAKAMGDPDAVVRREAAIALGFCGSRRHLAVLLDGLADSDWTVRQGSWVALTNITAMELPFDALAEAGVRAEQIAGWRRWVEALPGNRAREDILALVRPAIRDMAENLALGAKVSVSSIYKGPAEAVTDGLTGPAFWQTKNVKFPQWCTIDLGRVRKVGAVVVVQYGSGFCMTDYRVEVSTDGRKFEKVFGSGELSAVRLVAGFGTRDARYVRIVSNASERGLYPTTFREVEVYEKAPKLVEGGDELWYNAERGMRALGILGGKGAIEAVTAAMRPYVRAAPDDPAERTMVQAAIRALGQLGGPKAEEILISMLENPLLARYAADALGDCDDDAGAMAMMAVYPRYARAAVGKPPAVCPVDDQPGLEPADRMYETPYAIIHALGRMSLRDEATIAKLRELAPLILMNLPSDYDAGMLYEVEAHELITAWLLERVGVRKQACRAALRTLGCKLKEPASEFEKAVAPIAASRQGGIPEAAHWLAALCKDREDVGYLIGLLEDENGWVRINAAKALAFLDAKEAIGPISRVLEGSKTEAEYGYNGKWFFLDDKIQGQSEYNDPPPRWRQAYARVLGLLGARECVPLLIKLLFDERNVLEVQMAAAQSLDQIGGPEAVRALVRAEAEHPFYSIQLFAREALWRRDAMPEESPAAERPAAVVKAPGEEKPAGGAGGFVFIQGSNDMPNDFQIDHWRQTYSTTDSGPAYRMGRNLMVLEADGRTVRRLTRFTSGYVADCEVSYDGMRVIFSRRGEADDPWWQIYEINADGSGLRKLTEGPYHNVGPFYLPDGRIVFSTSRLGIRDEYHGYYATGLATMEADGSDIRIIGLNLGRDNEPSVLDDGRIVFSRLELFYSRLKTELTVHAVFPDGTGDVTLYGPERRDFWRDVTRRSKEKWWGEVPPRHRVLRTTQPQEFAPGRILCASTGGLVITGPGRYRETMVDDSGQWAFTSPYPMGDGRIVCAASRRTFDRKAVDLGLYFVEAATGKMTLLYNDPAFAEFEPRPLAARKKPVVLAQCRASEKPAFTCRFLCQSIRHTQQARVARRGKLVRVIEGLPAVARHQSHLSGDGPAWKNHAGTFARVLGTVPLAADGSFYIEIPADRLVHVQVLDSDRRVVGNQLIWMYARGGETRGCVGCHERPDTTAVTQITRFPLACKVEPVKCLPTGGEFSYRAKFWNKGTLPDEGEERTRTVRAVNLAARH